MAVGTTGRIAQLKPFDIRHEISGLGVCSDGFQSCLGPVFPHYGPIAAFRSGIHSVPLRVGSTYIVLEENWILNC